MLFRKIIACSVFIFCWKLYWHLDYRVRIALLFIGVRTLTHGACLSFLLTLGSKFADETMKNVCFYQIGHFLFLAMMEMEMVEAFAVTHILFFQWCFNVAVTLNVWSHQSHTSLCLFQLHSQYSMSILRLLFVHSTIHRAFSPIFICTPKIAANCALTSQCIRWAQLNPRCIHWAQSKLVSAVIWENLRMSCSSLALDALNIFLLTIANSNRVILSRFVAQTPFFFHVCRSLIF